MSKSKSLTIRNHSKALQRMSGVELTKGGEILIADRSGSMLAPVAGLASTTRIDCVNNVIRSYGPLIQTISFSDDATSHIGPVTLEADNGTNLAGALALALRYSPNYLLVLSDGRVNDEQAALDLAEALSTMAIIDTLYIGGHDPEAEAFLAKIAQIGHGRARVYDMTKPQTLALETVIKGLLPPPIPQLG
jgi:hypothetical protein